MASGAPGGNFRTWTPTPPERGSFPLDHEGECKSFMESYLKCMKFTENKNAPNCRILAKQYLKCRMDHQLMEDSNWESLGLVNLPGEENIHEKDLHNLKKGKDGKYK
ncbi:COX19 Cytochrome c oxidase assembly protein COX19 [Candida maltosa Xu316]|uniref:Copper metallochaperone, required for cytochrome c oxidase assembly, putative n=1 Tax=Candida maltosa (strain Xu316) TaxID=1245528 RepID=M3HFW1_CANMX|nr:Copper metallochaperone, required for cytochrome c oxidase assembly, putative [Candida maltosa Xu316]